MVNISIKQFRIFVLFLFTSIFTYAQEPFIIEVTIPDGGSDFLLPINDDSQYNPDYDQYSYNVDWGDGLVDDTTYTTSAIRTYTNNTGVDKVYVIKITGTFPAIYFGGALPSNKSNDDLITRIVKWGDNVWSTMYGAFDGCDNLTIADDAGAPNLSNLTNMNSMFHDCNSLTADLSSWDVSNIEDMSYLFSYCYNFNSNLSSWNVSNVKNMRWMFYEALAFNNNSISNWNVSNVENMEGMFADTFEFNQDLSNWNVSKVIIMSEMFDSAVKFNGNISNWDVSNVQDFGDMFDSCYEFNQDLSNWDLTSVTDISNIFSGTVMSLENLDATLIGWATDSSGVDGDGIDDIPNNLAFKGKNFSAKPPGGGTPDLVYCLAQEAVQILEAKGWVFTSDFALASDDCESVTTAGNWTDIGAAVTDNVFIDESIIINASPATANGLHVSADGSLTIASGNGLNLSGNFTSNGTITLSDGATLIANGNASGNLTYNRTIPTTKWYLISVPVAGQDISEFVTVNDAVLATSTNVATRRTIGVYDTANNAWVYYDPNDAAIMSTYFSDDFDLGQGIAVKVNNVNDVIKFTGTISVANKEFTLNTTGDDRFNFIGNPFPSYIPSNTPTDGTNGLLFLNSGLLEEATLWFFDQNSGNYQEVNNANVRYIPPTQGFFVRSSASGGDFVINKAGQTHQSNDNFQRSISKTSNTRPELKVTLSNGTEEREIDVYYISGTTVGFDNGYDSSIFGGITNNSESTQISFKFYSKLVSDENDTRKFGIQSLPDTDLESMVIPLGINSVAGDITLKVTSLNLPTGLKVYLEDKETNTFTELTDSTEHQISLASDVLGSGRFYLHTTSNSLSVDDTILSRVSMYTSNKELLVRGLEETAQVSVFNLLGREVIQEKGVTNASRISLSNLSTGLYIVSLETSKGKLTKKIIVE